MPESRIDKMEDTYPKGRKPTAHEISERDRLHKIERQKTNIHGSVHRVS